MRGRHARVRGAGGAAGAVVQPRGGLVVGGHAAVRDDRRTGGVSGSNSCVAALLRQEPEGDVLEHSQRAAAVLRTPRRARPCVEPLLHRSVQPHLAPADSRPTVASGLRRGRRGGHQDAPVLLRAGLEGAGEQADPAAVEADADERDGHVLLQQEIHIRRH